MERVDAVAKVTGTARYAGDLRPDGPVDVVVAVTGARCGRITIDDTAARAMPGVRAVLTHRNAPRLSHPNALGGSELGARLPLQDDRVAYPGECVALVIAATLVEARAAAAAVAIDYSDPAPVDLAVTLSQAEGRVAAVKRAGTVAGVITRGRVREVMPADVVSVDATYGTRPAHHNAIEPGAVIARWEDDGGLSIEAPVQWSELAALAVAQTFGFGYRDGIPGTLGRIFGVSDHARRVRIAPTLVGGSFGRNNSELFLVLAAMAAKANGRAVRFELSRQDSFSLMPGRGETRAHLRVAATPDGRLTDLSATLDVAQGRYGAFVEPLGEGMAHVYACANVDIRHRLARLDLSSTGWMRAPGNGPGMFALETALDELAVALDIDPLDLRLINHSDDDPQTGKRWSSKSLLACYAAGADAVGWRGRPCGGSLSDDGRLLGWGMATAIHLNRQFPASARVTLNADGSAQVDTCMSELGQGRATALTLIAAEALGIAPEAVTLRWTDPAAPPGGPAFASAGTLSTGAAIEAAVTKIRRALRVAPPRAGRGAARGDLVAALVRRGRASCTAQATTGRTLGMGRAPSAAFGAQFAVVSVDPETFETRVERMVGAFACGRVVNAPVLRGQLVGGMTWGIGHALMEETHPDRRTGAWLNDNLAEALVPTHADARDIDAILIDEDDRRNHPLGIKGGGEIGLVGAAAAIGNAIFDATGRRYRTLPIRPHDDPA